MGKGTDWIELWMQDWESMHETMLKNMQADLACGYKPHGEAIQNQIAAIHRHDARWDRYMERAVDSTDVQMNRWCYLDLRRRGVIA